jgi:6-pyruvoyltetrahydropterin/6-carboxytetrahydropterin synthase
VLLGDEEQNRQATFEQGSPSSGLLLEGPAGGTINVGHKALPGLYSCPVGWGIMFEVTVEDTFAAGHYLRNYKGKCENPHGHNYKIRVTLAGAELDKAGLLLDFKDLREVMKHVIERLDHQMINEIEPFTVINPSAENLAKYFYDESNTRLQSVTSGRVRVKDVTVFETDTTTAKYSE